MKLKIYLDSQLLELFEDSGKLLKRYPVSTAKKGSGQQFASYCTPLGLHYIRAKIGDGKPYAAVFRARRWTGEICSHEKYLSEPNRDWILSRILWLCGKETGLNRLGNVDTFRRFIYIHGIPDEVCLDKALSHGCVRMRNADLIELFALVDVGCDVDILKNDEK